MSLEKSLWQRVKKGGVALKILGHDVHMGRLENVVGTGNPDVDICLDAVQIWLELKSEHRPARPGTSIRPKVRVDQEIWLRERVEAGCRNAFVLLQVGENALSRLYLIPGSYYSVITTTEDRLGKMSIVNPRSPMTTVLLQAKIGW